VLVLDHLLGVVPRGASQCWRAHSDPGRIIELLDADDALQPRRRAHLDARVGEDKNYPTVCERCAGVLKEIQAA